MKLLGNSGTNDEVFSLVHELNKEIGYVNDDKFVRNIQFLHCYLVLSDTRSLGM